MSLIDNSVRDLLAAFSSGDPTPGGGSASALASAMGASLLMMVACMPKTRSNTEEDRQTLQAAHAALARLQKELAEAIDLDSAAYDQVVAAYKRPKGTPAEQHARKADIDRALRGAIDVPLRVMRLSAEALSHGVIVAVHGNRNAASDVGVGAALLRTGAGGAFLNVEINLEGIGEEEYRKNIGAEIQKLTEAIEGSRRMIEGALDRDAR